MVSFPDPSCSACTECFPFVKKFPNSAGLDGVPGPEQFEETNVPRGQARELACPARFRQPDAECDRTSMFAVFASEPRIYLSVFFACELEMVGARVYGRRDFDGAVGRLASGIDVGLSITSVQPMSDIADALQELPEIPGSMKTLIRRN